MKKYTIAEILHIAADKNLAAVESEHWHCWGGDKDKFSCCAVEDTTYELYRDIDEREEMENRIREGLMQMGCPVDSTDAFKNDKTFNRENQQARYAWLKFAAMIAEEQGV